MTHYTRTMLVGVVLVLASSSASAQSAASAVPSVGRLLLGLLVVLGLLLVCAYILKRGGLTGHSGVIKVVSQCPVGTRERVVLIQVGDQQLLIGVTAQSINLLHRLNDAIAVPTPAASGKFAEQLAQLMKRRS